MEQSKVAIELVAVIALIFHGMLRAELSGKADMDVLLGDDKPQSLFGDDQNKNSG